MDDRDLDALWDDLLSEDPARIRKAWGNLTDDETLSVLDHLRRMAAEPGWQPAQQQAAATALRVIQEQAE
ncbi:MAG: hypothetical protein ACRDH2_11480 [Anaerolineales bacterium]